MRRLLRPPIHSQAQARGDLRRVAAMRLPHTMPSRLQRRPARFATCLRSRFRERECPHNVSAHWRGCSASGIPVECSDLCGIYFLFFSIRNQFVSSCGKIGSR